MPYLKLFISLTLALCALSAKAQNSSRPVINLGGKYEMHLQIEDKLFKDLLEIHCTFSWSNPCLGLFLEPQTTVVRGQLEVPTVFIAPLKRGLLVIKDQLQSATLEFEILAKENGKEFFVYYKAEIPEELYQDIAAGKSPPVFKGTAYLKDNKLLGHFTAVKIE